ncbi:MAG: hypothetical protein AAFO99_05200 [Bacteroidota bacterium]
MKFLLKKALVFLCFIPLFTSCLGLLKDKEENLSLAEDFNTVRINDQYSIALPKYMKEATNLNDDASLQYQNIFKEAYVVVIDEPKQDLIDVFKELEEWDDNKSVVENYRDIQLQFFTENITVDNQSPSRALKINGMDAEIVEIDGKAQDVIYDIAYTLGFVEGEKNVYMIMAWTLKDKRKKFKKTYDLAIKSFELL